MSTGLTLRHHLARIGVAAGAVLLSVAGLATVAGATPPTGLTLSASGTPSAGNIGETLTPTPSGGTFSNSAGYQWYDCTSSVNYVSPSTLSCGSSISTSATYTLQSSDNGKFVAVVVTDASVTYQSASFYATSLAASLTGAASAGSTVTASASGGSGSGWTYQFYYCSSPTSAGLQAAYNTTPNGCTSFQSASSTTTATVPAAAFNNYVTVVAIDGTAASALAKSTSLVTEPAPTVLSSPTLAVVSTDTNAGTQTEVLTPTNGFNTLYNATPTYQWYDCAAQVQSATTTLPSGCNAISATAGGTASQYTYAVSDAGSWVTVALTETNAVGSATVIAASMSTAVVATAPTYSSGLTLGTQTATTLSFGYNNVGTWNGYPPVTSYTATWYRCLYAHISAPATLPGDCSSISSFTLNSNSQPAVYTFTSNDLSRYLLVGVVANNGVVSTNVAFTPTSAQIAGVAPSPAVDPSISASPNVGLTASVSTGTWTGVPIPTPTNFTYAWYYCTSAPTATGQSSATIPPTWVSTNGCAPAYVTTSTWTLPTSVSGKYLVAGVTATTGAGTWTWFAVSGQVGAAVISSSGSVSLGSNVNGVYTATPSFSGGTPTPTSFSYTWYDCTVNVNAAFSTSAPTMTGCQTSYSSSNSPTHAVTSSDMADSNATGGLVVVVTATTSYTNAVYAVSSPTTISTATLTPTGITVTGTGTSSAPFSASATWTALYGVTPTYTWYLCQSSIPNRSSVATYCTTAQGTGPTYTPTSFNATYPYAVAVATATNTVGTSTQYSAGTQIVVQPVANSVAPTVPATASTATSLVASPGVWSGVPTPSFAYQWYVCSGQVVASTAGATPPFGCSAISGATLSSYLPSGSYVGDYFLIGVSATNGSNGVVTVYSASTTTALVSTLAVTGISIVGTPTVGSTLSAVPTVSAQSTYSTTYQWYQCTAPIAAFTVSVPSGCSAIYGATGSSYTLGVNQDNYYVTALVTVTSGVTSATGVAPTTQLVTTNIPGAPSGVYAYSGIGQATVSWTKPVTGLAPTSYTVTASPGGATCTSTTTTCVVTGLLFPTPYTFTVTATNGYGTGPASTASNAITPSESVPTAPTTVSGVAGVLSATVTWSGANANGAVISSYTVTASPGGATCSSATTSCVVTGLNAGTAYTFTVMARNAVGLGPSSFASAAVTPNPNVPSSPVGVSVKRGNHQLSVSWSAGPANGSTVTGYVVTATGGGNSAYCQTAGATSCTVNGLVNGVVYALSVVAKSSGGSSTATSGPSISPAGAPGAPSITRGVARPGAIVVLLRAPAQTNGAPVAYYQYLVNGRWTVQPIKGRLVFVIRGLARHHAYIVRVRAVSVGGASGVSNAVRVITQ